MRLTLLQVLFKTLFVERADLTPGTTTLCNAPAGGCVSTVSRDRVEVLKADPKVSLETVARNPARALGFASVSSFSAGHTETSTSVFYRY